MAMTNIQPYIEALQSKWWRLNKLYHIRDKEGKLRLLVPNHAQSLIHAYELRYSRLLILKSRQQGVSTYKVADQLDDCLNIAGIATGIQSYGKTESKKLRDKAVLMYNMLDPVYLQLLGVKLTSANSEMLEFSNGSILRIGNFRGDTLQRFHVSELAKISSKYPDKAREIQTGAFEAVSKDSRITVETTAEGDRGLFPDLWKQAEAIQLSGQQLTELDFYPLFISWLSDPDCQLQILQPPSEEAREYCKRHNLVVQDRPEPSFAHYVKGVHYSDDPKASLTPYTITLQQASWLTSKMRALGEDFDREYPITPDTAFAVSVEGSYFRKQFEILHREGRIQPSLYRPSLPVYTSWDIGWNDEMVILFWQVIGGKILLIDEYHNDGESLGYYVDVLNAKPYSYKRHFLPHDVEVHEVGSGRTRLESLRRLGVSNITVVKKVSFADSIQVARDLLVSQLLVQDNCIDTISAIQNYKKKKDEKLGVYLERDVHDIHSNYMAAFRYGALGISTHLVRLSIYDSGKKKKKLVEGIAL